MFRITALRRGKGWSKAELGRRSRIAPETVCRLEAGKVYPYPGWRKRLARVLHVPADELFVEVSEAEAALGGKKREQARQG